jgi:peptide chain release factor 1
MNDSIIRNIGKIVQRYSELCDQLVSPEVLSTPSLLSKIAKERSTLEPQVELFKKYQKLSSQFQESERLMHEDHDPELIALAREESETLRIELDHLEEEMKLILLPRDPMDNKDIVMEIRAGTGGEEAALFVSDLYRMYTHYAEMKGWIVEVLSSTPSDIGGFKEVILSISGSAVYSFLKYESGVHRVQRVPVTEASGRIHTSAASVVVMPEAEDVTIDLNMNDLKVDVYRSSGPGGQSVNTTDSAVRITHIPTGIVVTCQDEKSQLKNKNKAMKVLRARLLDRALEEQRNKRDATRRSMIGTGDRSEKIRTYNFPQNRLTDHRINLTLYRLDGILMGKLGEVIEAIQLEDRKHALEVQVKG